MSIFLPNFNKSKAGGYTLIELLVVVTIAALLFTVTTASYRGYQKRQIFEAGVRNIMADIRLAQEYALAGKLLDPLVCNTGLQGYKVSKTGPSEYAIIELCNATETEFKRVNLNPDGNANGIFIDIRGRTGLTYFVFSQRGRGVDVSPVNYACIAISQTGSTSRFYRIDRVTGNVQAAVSC